MARGSTEALLVAAKPLESTLPPLKLLPDERLPVLCSFRWSRILLLPTRSRSTWWCAFAIHQLALSYSDYCHVFLCLSSRVATHVSCLVVLSCECLFLGVVRTSLLSSCGRRSVPAVPRGGLSYALGWSRFLGALNY